MRSRCGVAAVALLFLNPAMISATQQADTNPLVSALASRNRVRVKTTSKSVPGRGLVVKDTDSLLTVVGIVEGTDATELTLVDDGKEQVRFR